MAVDAVYGMMQGRTVLGLTWEEGKMVNAQVGCGLIGACIHNHEEQRALDLFRDMKTWPGFTGPSVDTFNALISGLLRIKMVSEAAAIAEEYCTTDACKSSEHRLDRAVMKRLSGAIYAKRHLRKRLSEPVADVFRRVALPAGSSAQS